MNRILDICCTACGLASSFNSDAAPDLPPNVAAILMDGCPECDPEQGETAGTEEWYDACGRMIVPEWVADIMQAQGRAILTPIRRA